MSKTLSTAAGTLDWADAREGDYIRVNETRHKVTRHSGECMAGWFHAGMWRDLGGVLERDVPEHPLEEVEDGTIIRDSWGDVYKFAGVNWCALGVVGAMSTRTLIERVGGDYEVLWPKPEVPKIEAGQVWRHEDGRYFRPVKVQSKLALGTWRGTYGGANWSSRGLATAEGLVAAGFRLDTNEEGE